MIDSPRLGQRGERGVRARETRGGPVCDWARAARGRRRAEMHFARDTRPSRLRSKPTLSVPTKRRARFGRPRLPHSQRERLPHRSPQPQAFRETEPEAATVAARVPAGAGRRKARTPWRQVGTHKPTPRAARSKAEIVMPSSCASHPPDELCPSRCRTTLLRGSQVPGRTAP